MSTEHDVTAPFAPAPRTPVSGSHPSSSSNDAMHGRFIPGTVIAERYRIVGLLGKGGMGEVYRADDLRLGAAVALKFLPTEFAGDSFRYERFLDEVRLARQISHPNVCRVFDIGEVDDQVFLSMEFVDGEDLASLLRRIGRLPVDKGIQIARQLCSGLAAAHEKGVLHRDLKPANIMLDGRGHVRITDFGLARQVTSVAAGDIRSGTPAYMAPEQLAGKEVTIRSDLFALGLVLFEVFTGKRVFKAESFGELVKLHEKSTPISLSTQVPDLDVDVERQIRRCLEKDPQRRPKSVSAVLASLPGGDPLAAALAAGETPSPEMVADAGDEGTISPRAGLGLMAIVLVSLACLAYFSRYQLLHLVPLQRPPQELAYEARRIISNLVSDEPPASSDYHFYLDYGFLSYVPSKDKSVTRWNRLATGQPAAVYFWYLQSPELLQPFPPGTITPTNPPLVRPGMVAVSLDLKGRLIDFRSVPTRTKSSGESAPDLEPDWSELFRAAGLEASKFATTEPRWTPPVYADTRAAWTGVFPDWPEFPLRVEAAAYLGEPVYFSMIGPWVRPPTVERGSAGTSFQSYVILMLPLVVLLGGGWLARYNWRRGRVDRRGAFRLAACIFLFHMAAWASVTHHVPVVATELYLFQGGLGNAFYKSAMVWIAYLAVEPHVRQRWPWRIISWSRLLAGRLRDPFVGRHLLAGAALGAWSGTFIKAHYAVPGLIGLPPYAAATNVCALTHRVYSILGAQLTAIDESLILLFVFLLLTIVFRKEWLATIMIVVVAMVYYGGRGIEYAWLEAVFVAVAVLVYVSLFLRIGILPIVAALCVHWLIFTSPVTTVVTSWYFAHSTSVMLMVVGLAAYGLVTTVGSDGWSGEKLLET